MNITMAELEKQIASALAAISDIMYTYILVALLIAVGLYFFVRTRALPLRLFKEAIRVVTEPPHEEGEVSSFRALMVSTASRVGVGNIAGVATAVASGGPGAVFWMWIIATLGGASVNARTDLQEARSAPLLRRPGLLHPDGSQAELAGHPFRGRFDRHLHGRLQPSCLV